MNKREVILLFLLSMLIAFFFGKWIPFEDQKAILENITSTTSIIFAILGIWLALFYPDTISSIFNENEKQNLKEIYKNEKNLIFKKLSLSLIITTFILISCILSNILIFIVKNIDLFKPYKSILRSLMFTYLLTLSLGQIFALLSALLPNSYLEFALNKNHENINFAKRNGPISKRKK